MIRISDKRKCIASLATFRNMYSKADIFDIIAELAKQTIVEYGVTRMRIDEFYPIFKNETGIEVPMSMLETSLKRLPFIVLEKKEIATNETLTKELCDEVKQSIGEQEKKNNLLFESLKLSVEEEERRVLTKEEEKDLINTFCSHIVDDAYTGPFIEHVCSFILKNENNVNFIEYLNQLREGTIIFVGYTYTAHDGFFDKIDTTIKIYMETEILFHMAGYNGPLFKTLFDEFFQQVTDINKKARKQIIKLYYFEETEIEINNYFTTACRIVEREEIPDPTKQAMRHITEGCSEAYQVKTKQDAFYRLLKENGITLDKQNNYNDVGTYAFTIEHSKFLEMEDASEDRINEKLKFLNNINVKRGGRPQKIFRNIGHLLLSGNSLTFKIANDEAVRPKNSLPLVFGLGALTNRFWLSLNRGIIPDMRLNNFNMIAKSRVALAGKLKVAISKIYKEIEIELKEEKITLDQAKESLAGLRRDSMSPDQLSIDNLERSIFVIKNSDLELYISSQENERKREEKRKEEMARQISEAEGKALSAEGRAKAFKDLSDAAVDAVVEERNKTIKEEFDSKIENYKSVKDEKVRKLFKKYKRKQWLRIGLYFLVYVFLFACFYCLTKKPIKGIFGIVIVAIVNFVWYAVPFWRPIAPFEKLKKAYLFIMNKEERKRVWNQIGKEYEDTNPIPKCIMTTAEEVRKEIELKAQKQ